MRDRSREGVPIMRHDERAHRQVLRGVRHRAHDWGSIARRRSGCAADGRAATRLRPFRRPGRVHGCLRAQGRRGRARAAVALFRDRAHHHRALRRHRREVHRRRRDGRMGCPGGARGRRGARGPGRAGTGYSHHRARNRGGDPGASRPRRSPDRRSRGHSRRRGQGMVAGDLVNTASRIQSEAEPGSVLVGEATKRAAEAAVVFEDAGAHTLKGKSEPLQLWQAVRVIGLRGGASRSTALEPPFVGRDRELRLVKELFHGSSEDRHGHLVSVVGIGGIGKSRLAWEFEKYIDGLAGDVWWHSGRCLAYGDGVAFWALAEMIRGRAGIVEDEEAASALAKLRVAIEEHVPDPQERRFVEPRLAHLLGLEEGASGDQENLFAAARMFFERLAQQGPTVLLFEDIHWADSALLDFIEYVIEWSRDVPLFVVTLARPDLADRRPTWGFARRNFTSIFLEPLSTDS
ncbi:MAG: AAA family ATPase, partial [Actinomycetota bacterium]|nr:AAA family ATPase [Actinomycetota bacterium]